MLLYLPWNMVFLSMYLHQGFTENIHSKIPLLVNWVLKKDVSLFSNHNKFLHQDHIFVGSTSHCTMNYSQSSWLISWTCSCSKRTSFCPRELSQGQRDYKDPMHSQFPEDFQKNEPRLFEFRKKGNQLNWLSSSNPSSLR